MKVDHERKKIYVYVEDSFLEFDKKDKLNKKRKLKRKKSEPYNGKITSSDYKIIIAKFIRIWLFNLLKSKGYYYFPFTGSMAKYKTNDLFVIDRSTKEIAKKRVYKQINPTLGFFWRRGDMPKLSLLKFNKENGKNDISQMIQDWLKLYNVHDLLTLKERKNEVVNFLKNKL